MFTLAELEQHDFLVRLYGEMSPEVLAFEEADIRHKKQITSTFDDVY